MTSQQITANMVRKIYLVSRHGLVLRVTEDTIEGSQHRTEDVYSKLNSFVLYTHFTQASRIQRVQPFVISSLIEELCRKI